MNNGIKHICFDKDGTLIDVHKYWSHTCSIRAELIVKEFSLTRLHVIDLIEVMGIDAKLNRIKKGGPVGYKPRNIIIDGVTNYIKSLDIKTSSEEINIIFKHIDTYQQKSNDYMIEILYGVKDFLAAAKNKNYFMTVFSSDRKDNTIKIMQKLNIEKYFSTIVGGDSVKNPKPHHEGFVTACNEVNIKCEDTTYVSDTVDDLKMAIKGGARFVVGVETGLNTANELRQFTNYVYNDLSNFDFSILN